MGGLAFGAGAFAQYSTGGIVPPDFPILPAYLDDFFDVAPEGRFIDVPAEGRFIDVPPVGRITEVK